MIQSAVADIIGPAVAAKDPDGFLCELVLVFEDARNDFRNRRALVGRELSCFTHSTGIILIVLILEPGLSGFLQRLHHRPFPQGP